MSECKMCRERGKTWEGGDPKCAFPDGAAFDAGNWNCATANAIRDLCGYWDEPPDGIKREHVDDQTYATILTHDIDFVGAERHHWCLWITWYKRRGRTGGMWLLGDEADPPAQKPTEADLLAILAHYERVREPTG